jgi:hypothetical protein
MIFVFNKDFLLADHHAKLLRKLNKLNYESYLKRVSTYIARVLKFNTIVFVGNWMFTGIFKGKPRVFDIIRAMGNLG